MNINKKYYCGGKDILMTDSWRHSTEAEAIKHAEELLDENDDYPERDHVVIVKIIGIVKRKKTPITYEKVK
jgi:hypothetical protein